MRRMNQSRSGGNGCRQCSASNEASCETVRDRCGGTMNVYRMSATPWYPCTPGSLAADMLCAAQEGKGCGHSQNGDCGGCSGSADSGSGIDDLRAAVERCEAAAREACEAAREANQAACEARESACKSCESAEQAQRSACESCECAEQAQHSACESCKCAEQARGGGNNGRNGCCR